MKTIRLLYPDHLSGGLDTYYFGANLLAHILPANENQPLLRVEIAPPDGKERTVKDGIRAREEVTEGIRRAAQVIEAAQPDKIITIGGNCIVSQAPFDYLHGRYSNVGIIWIDAHPDAVSYTHLLGFDFDVEWYTVSSKASDYIGEAKAKQIVEQAAGTTGVYTEFKLEVDDGRVLYEGEMRSGWMEYEFEIDAVTGAILDWDADWD